MLVVLLAFVVAVFGLMMVGGFTWALIDNGQSRKMSNEEAGKFVAEGVDAIPPQKTFFKGKAVGGERTAEYSFAGMKDAIREGDARWALPALLAMVGMFGLFIFGGVLLVALGATAFGLVILAMGIYSLIRTLISFARA